MLTRNNFSLFLFLLIGSYSCIKIAPTSRVEAPNIAEAREQADIFYDIWDEDFIRKFKELPDKGEARKKPYTGHWYPHRHGGTARIFKGKSQSALHKYDRAFPAHDGATAVAWEKRYHSSRGGNWQGHCNGYAGAAQRYREPRYEVIRNGVRFTPADIKALLTEVHLHLHTYILGGRRCHNVIVESAISGGTSCPAGFHKIMLSNGKAKCIKNPPTRAASPQLSACEDVNAGTFHLALANWVGRREQTIIFDKEAYHQVWNYPLFKYHLESESRFISKAEALRYTKQRGNRYPFNRAATSFYYAKMRIGYAQVLQNSESSNYPTFKESSEVYTYILEIDDFGDIVGGEWIGESYHKHPDFLWIALEPQKSLTVTEAKRVMSGNALQRYLKGHAARSNPYIDPMTVNDLWAESVGLEPGSTPPPLSLPDRSSAWGQDPRFSVLLDGDTSGSAFLGKEVNLTITLTNEQDSDSLRVSLNNSAVEPVTRANAELNFMLTPRPGINKLHLAFDNDPVEKKIIFHAAL